MSAQEPTPADTLSCVPAAVPGKSPPPRPRSADEARRWFQDRGKTVVEWALQRGFNPGLVNAVLHGRRKCVRGQSHEIAVALGLKKQPDGDDWDPEAGHVASAASSSREPALIADA